MLSRSCQTIRAGIFACRLPLVRYRRRAVGKPEQFAPHAGSKVILKLSSGSYSHGSNHNSPVVASLENGVLTLQNIVLEMIAKGKPLADTASRLCLEAEKLAPGAICSILTVDNSGIVHPLAGPSLPSTYSVALDGLKIGPATGSCGTAAYLRSEVTVTDIEADSRWDDYRHLALPIGLRACWYCASSYQ